MSIRFVPASRADSTPVARTLKIRRGLVPANDNGRSGTETLLDEALRHFARHGLGAAGIASDHAQRAFFAGDRVRYQHWLDICRLLDQRMAAAVAFRKGNSGPR